MLSAGTPQISNGLRGVLGDHVLELAVAGRVGLHPLVVDPAVGDHLVQGRIEQRDVGAGADGQVHIGPRGDRRAPGIDHHEPGRARAVQPVEHPRPQHGLGFGHVMPDQEQGVARVDIGVGARVAIAAERLHQRPLRRRRAQPGVAVQVRSADAAAGDHALGVILLREQLPRGVERHRQAPVLVDHLPGTLGHPGHRGFPVRFPQLTSGTDERAGQPVRRIVCPPAK
jgi:hypothetical protein